MNNKRQILTAITAVLISVGLVATAVYATTTIGNDVDVGGTLGVTGATTLDTTLTVTGVTTLNEGLIFGEVAEGNRTRGTYIRIDDEDIGLTTPADVTGAKLDFIYATEPTVTGAGKGVVGLNAWMRMDYDYTFASANRNADVRGARLQTELRGSLGGILTGVYANAITNIAENETITAEHTTGAYGAGMIALEARTEIKGDGTLTVPHIAGVYILSRRMGSGGVTGDYHAIHIENSLGTGAISGTETGIHFEPNTMAPPGTNFDYGIDMNAVEFGTAAIRMGAGKLVWDTDVPAGQRERGSYIKIDDKDIGLATPADVTGAKLDFIYATEPTVTGAGKGVVGLNAWMRMDYDYTFVSANRNADVRGARLQTELRGSLGGILTGVYANAITNIAENETITAEHTTGAYGAGMIALEARTEIKGDGTLTVPHIAGVYILSRRMGSGGVTGDYHAIHIEESDDTGSISGTETGIHFEPNTMAPPGSHFDYGIDMNAVSFDTADIRLSSGGTITNVGQIVFAEDTGRTGEGTHLFANGLSIGMATPGDAQGIKMEFDYGVTPTLSGGGKSIHGLDIKMTMDQEWNFTTADRNAVVRGARIQGWSEDDVGGRVMGIYSNARAEGTSKTLEGYFADGSTSAGLISIEARTELGTSATITTPRVVGLLVYHHQKTGSTLTGEYAAIQIDQPLTGTISGDMYGIYFTDDHKTGYAYDYAFGFDTNLDIDQVAHYDQNVTGAGMSFSTVDGWIKVDIDGQALYLYLWDVKPQ